jgi:hypothetical protein
MKSIFYSRTFWVAVAQSVIGVWAVLESSMPNVGWVVVGKSVLDIILRFISTTPVKML